MSRFRDAYYFSSSTVLRWTFHFYKSLCICLSNTFPSIWANKVIAYSFHTKCICVVSELIFVHVHCWTMLIRGIVPPMWFCAIGLAGFTRVVDWGHWGQKNNTLPFIKDGPPIPFRENLVEMYGISRTLYNLLFLRKCEIHILKVLDVAKTWKDSHLVTHSACLFTCMHSRWLHVCQYSYCIFVIYLNNFCSPKLGIGDLCIVSGTGYLNVVNIVG